jgi:hypothetical protein
MLGYKHLFVFLGELAARLFILLREFRNIYISKHLFISPTVINTDPIDNATDVPADKTINVNFSEDIQLGDAFENIIIEDESENPASVSKSVYDNTLTLDPLSNLEYNTTYIVTLPVGSVEDMAENPLTELYSFSFTTMTVQEAVYGINDYIQSLPDSAFGGPTPERTGAFANKFAAIDKMLKAENYQGAIKILQNDICPKADGTIDGKLKDDWNIDPASQEDKCRMIDEIIENLQPYLK